MSLALHPGLPDALLALKALREAGGLAEQRFQVPAFVGMISDEIEALRKQGKTDAQIVAIIEQASPIRITPEEIARFYAPPEARQHGDEQDA